MRVSIIVGPRGIERIVSIGSGPRPTKESLFFCDSIWTGSEGSGPAEDRQPIPRLKSSRVEETKMGGKRQELLPEQYRAQRLSGAFSIDPAIRALLAQISQPAQPGSANVIAQAFQGAGGAPVLDMGVLPPELQVNAATPPGQAPNTGTLPPQVQAQATAATPAPAGTSVPVAPQLAALESAMGSEKGGAGRDLMAPQTEGGKTQPPVAN